MGQKVHPTGIRLGIVKDWASKWYADSKTFPKYIHADHVIRTVIKKKLKDASVSRIAIERPANKVNVTIFTARPGIVIGKKGEDIEKLRSELSKTLGMLIQDVRINISEVRKPELDAQLVAEGIAQQLERRVMFRRAMKRAVTNTMRVGAEGIKVKVGGPLERCGNRAFRVVSGGSCTATYAARGHRLRNGRGTHDLRCDRRESLDIQGRGLRQARSDSGRVCGSSRWRAFVRTLVNWEIENVTA